MESAHGKWIVPHQHRAIVESIKNHDETGLQKAIFGHLNNVNIMFNKLHPELEQYVCRN